jgi:hypothetical protein
MRHILTIAILGVLGTSLVGCGKSDAAATELCNQYAAAVCERYLTCQAEAETASSVEAIDTVPFTCGNNSIKRPTWFPPELACSKDVSDCTSKLRALECGSVAANRCTSGATYHADKAQACVSGWKTLGCEDVQQAASVDPAIHQPVECYQICTTL